MNHDDDIGSLIKAITNLKDTIENRELKQYGISAGQMHILLHLYEADHYTQSLKQLEKEMNVSQSTMAKMVRNLVEDKHLAAYTVNPEDKRVKNVVLTNEAIPLCQSSAHIIDQMEAMLTGTLSTQEVQSLREMLSRIYYSMKEGKQHE